MMIMDSKIHIQFVLLLSCLFFGCTTAPKRTEKSVELHPMPTYWDTGETWEASTDFFLSFGLGAETPEAVNVREQLTVLLEEKGYRSVSMYPYGTLEKRKQVDKLINIIATNWRYVTMKDGKKAWDMRLVVSVQDNVPWEDWREYADDKKFFQVWAREIDALPYKRLCEALLTVPGFREAMEPADG
jgi:hypothetical protein